VGGALGFGGKRVAVSYDELRLQGKEGYVLDATLDSLKARPEYTEDASSSPALRGGQGTVSRAEGKLDEWKGRLDDYTSKAESEGTEAGRVAAEQVNRAWESVKAQWSKLETATDDTMQDAMRAFGEAWENFRRDWRDTTSSET